MKEAVSDERVPPGPQSMLVYVTRKCNLRCVMCSTVLEPPRTLPYGFVERVWPLLPRLERIQWQGGEVFLVDYFGELLARVNAAFPSLRQYITTNGLLIDETWARLLADVNAEVTFSVDSVTKENYEGIRAGGRFERLRENLRLVRDAYRVRRPPGNVTLAIHVVVMRRNLDELSLFPEFCGQFGIGELRFLYLHPALVPGEYLFGKDAAGLRGKLAATIREVEAECRKRGINFDYFFRQLLDDAAGGAAATGRNGHSPRGRCPKPWTSLFIDTDGSVMPSCECSIPVGNIIDTPAEEIWNGKRMAAYRDRVGRAAHADWCSERCLRGLTNI